MTKDDIEERRLSALEWLERNRAKLDPIEYAITYQSLTDPSYGWNANATPTTSTKE